MDMFRGNCSIGKWKLLIAVVDKEISREIAVERRRYRPARIRGGSNHGRELFYRNHHD